MTATREAWLKRGGSTPHGTLGDLRTDRGTAYKTIERPWVDNLRAVSSIPAGRWLMLWKWSEKHGRMLYHAVAVPDRDEIEMHSANVFEQLQGCVALGRSAARFLKDSIHAGMPSEDMDGVADSVNAMTAFHLDMQDASGEQESFWLNIE